MNKEDLDKMKLEQYINQLFHTDYVDPRIQKQIKNYIKEYNFTYSGILKSLVYFYEVKQNPVEKSNDGIGIVPWVYKQAFNYYYAIWLAQQKNTNKTVENYIPKETEIIIPRPKPKPYRKHLFSFLDDKEDLVDLIFTKLQLLKTEQLVNQLIQVQM